MSKLKSAKKGVEKVIHSTPLRIWIGAGVAQPGPPLGPQLGQVCFEKKYKFYTFDLTFIMLLARNKYRSIL